MCGWGGGGADTIEAYSNCGLTSVLYATDFGSLLLSRMFLLGSQESDLHSWLYYQYGYSMIGHPKW